MYTPHLWCVIQTQDLEDLRVVGSWQGGYLDGDSWRINSGIEKVSLEDEFYLFHGFSGSIYKCHKSSYGMSSFASSVLARLNSQTPITVLDDRGDWTTIAT